MPLLLPQHTHEFAQTIVMEEYRRMVGCPLFDQVEVAELLQLANYHNMCSALPPESWTDDSVVGDLSEDLHQKAEMLFSRLNRDDGNAMYIQLITHHWATVSVLQGRRPMMLRGMYQGPDTETYVGQNVLKGMDCNGERNLRLIFERLPKFMHALGRDFAGVPGSRVYVAIQKGELSYRSWCLRKA